MDFTTERSYAGTSMVDCVIDMKQSGGVARTKKGENLYLEDTYIRGAVAICDEGFRIPSSEEWTLIERYSSHTDQGVNLINGVESTGEIIDILFYEITR